MQNYRYPSKSFGSTKRNKRNMGFAPLVALAVLIIGVFVGARMLLSRDTPNNNEKESDDIQTLESLLKNVNVPLETNSATSETSSSNRTACDRSFSTLPTTEQVIALTFDNSNIVDKIDSILQTLKNRNVPAFFFVTGDFARDHADVVKKIADAGFELGNHSDTHPRDFSSLSAVQIGKQISDASGAITQASGKADAKFFRPPYGSQSEESTAAVTASGYCSILWTTDGEDWKQDSTPDTVVTKVKDSLKPGSIIMLQFGYDTVDEALPRIITAAGEAGYRFVKLSDYFTLPSTTSTTDNSNTNT